MASRPLRVGIVAGEASGDILGASLMSAMQQRHPDIRFEGVGGPQMIAAGFNSHFEMERLSVMGLVEPLKRLPELLRMRAALKKHFINNPPDVFVGIDSPDFTLNIEATLKRQGIKTAHYVSPSVWAWRQGRVKTIARSVDLMLTLLPFEAQFYVDHAVPVKFVGHPLADLIPLDDQQEPARQALGIAPDQTVLAVLPGSRAGEVKQLAPVFLDTLDLLKAQRPDVHCIIPAANSQRRQQLEQLLGQRRTEVRLVDGQSRTVMAAANAVLMASGTTTLEAMLLKRPMVVGYRMGSLSYRILSPLIKTEFISLPNLLAGEALVPEIIQDELTPERLLPLIRRSLEDKEHTLRLKQRFLDIHRSIALNASEEAAAALFALMEQGNG